MMRHFLKNASPRFARRAFGHFRFQPAISSLSKPIRSPSSPTESSDKSCPISCDDLLLWQIVGIDRGHLRSFANKLAAADAVVTCALRAARRSALPPLAPSLPGIIAPGRSNVTARRLHLRPARRQDPKTKLMTALPDRMTVIAIREPGGPEMLTAEPRPVPKPEAGEILIKVAAAGVNRPDVMQRMGLYPPPPGATDIPGLEIAGEVVCTRSGRDALEERRSGDGAGRRRRLRAILRRP